MTPAGGATARGNRERSNPAMSGGARGPGVASGFSRKDA